MMFAIPGGGLAGASCILCTDRASSLSNLRVCCSQVIRFHVRDSLASCMNKILCLDCAGRSSIKMGRGYRNQIGAPGCLEDWAGCPGLEAPITRESGNGNFVTQRLRR